MPKFRFETVAAGRSTVIERDLGSADMASPTAIELAKAAANAAPAGADHAGSRVNVYDEAGYLVATVNFSDLLDTEPHTPSAPSDSLAEEPGVMRSG